MKYIKLHEDFNWEFDEEEFNSFEDFQSFSISEIKVGDTVKINNDKAEIQYRRDDSDRGILKRIGHTYTYPFFVLWDNGEEEWYSPNELLLKLNSR